MRLHRFYTRAPITKDIFDIADRELVSQWKNVFRYNVGSQVILFDGFGEDYLCLISSLRNLGATVSVVRKMKGKEKPETNLWLCLAIIKKDNFELMVQKATELGVSNIVPVLCERVEKKNLNLERLQKISIEAAEQSGSSVVPKIHEIVEFSKILDMDLLPNRVVALSPEGESFKKLSEEKAKDIAVFIGPEGGWSEREVESFKKHNVELISLGSPTLRAETAAIAISSLLLL